MKEQEYDSSVIRREGIDALLSFLPYYQNKRAHFGTAPRMIETSLHCSKLTRKSNDFYQACYENGFIQSFDWQAWSEANIELVVNGEGIESLSIEGIGKLITTHIRGDRFVDGHLLQVMKSGQMARILERLQVLRKSTT